MKLLLALFLALPAQGEIAPFADFSGGLNTHRTSVLLEDNESPSLQNVLLDENGSITKREGFSKLNATALADGDDDVNGVFPLEQSDGDEFCVAFSSTTGFLSSDACTTFTAFVSTLTQNNDVNCVGYQDKLFCANNQYNFLFDGTNEKPFTVAPADLDFLQVFRNRCFGAGTDATPLRLFWSNLGDCETWTTGTDFVDVDCSQGDVITALGEPLFNFLPVYCKFSTFLLQFDNEDTSKRRLIVVSKDTGAKHHRATANFMNRQYFDSVGPNGGQPGIYVTDGTLVLEASKKLRGELDLVDNFRSATGRQTVDTKTDWDDGKFGIFAMSSSRDQGFMQSSNTAITDTSTADFGFGTFAGTANTPTDGSVLLSSSTLDDNFEDGNFTDNPTWTVNDGEFEVIDGALYGRTKTEVPSTATENLIEIADLAITSGSWEFKFSHDNVNSFCAQTGVDCVDFRFIKESGGDFYAMRMGGGSARPLDLVKVVSGSESILSRVLIPAFASGVEQTVRVERSGDGVIMVFHQGVFISSTSDTDITSSATMEVGLMREACTEPACTTSGSRDISTYLNEVKVFQYPSTGTFTSNIFDTSISTPIWGLLEAVVSSQSFTRLTFEVQSSTAGDGGGFETLVSQALDIEILAAQRRFIRYVATLATDFATETPRMDSVDFQASSTGTWHSPELFLSNNITTWGTFQTQQTTTGEEASIAYSVKTATFAGGTDTASFVSLTVGGAITASTGAYIVVVGTWTIGVATETSKTDVLIFNWNEGTQARSATMKVFKNRLHYCAQSSGGAENDVCYILDSEGAWTKWTGVLARHLNVVGSNFVIAGSTETSGGFVYKMYDTNSDDGAAIDAFYESKDFTLGGVHKKKHVERIYLVHKDDDTTLTFTLKADTGLYTFTESVDLSTGMAFGIKNITVEPPLDGNVFRVRFDNNAASKPWEIQGYGLHYGDSGLIDSE